MATASVRNPAAEAIYAALNPRREEKRLSVVDEAQNRFLQLLTTQLKNQDPLNPLDNAQMTSQLAQISTVNGIEKLNATLQTLLAGMSDAQAMQAAALVNRGVLVPGASLTLGEAGALGGIELAGSADEVVVTIKDMNGLVMRSLNLGDLDAGVHPFVWDGKTDAGVPAASGKYSFSVTAKRGAEKVDATALAYGQVRSVTREGKDLSLEVGTLGSFALADIRQIF
ncbi:MAG: flagellar hook assembly protein FlgD [Rhodocyclaceae bacterium]|nr:flagellar hook assembly protein FlgD [Rhodocyclaceae bacterium]